MQITHIAVLVNPYSGRGKANKIGKWIKQELDNAGKKNTLFINNWPDSVKLFSDVFLVGGDGTTNYYINRYKDNSVPVSLFKGGTGNDLLWKLHGDASLQQQLNIALTSDYKEIDAGVCNGKLYLNSCGIGFDGAVLKSIKTIRWLGGHMGYLLAVIKQILNFKENHYSIKTNSETFDGRYLLVIINNSSRTGGGFMVTPRASITDKKLDVLLCDSLPVTKRLKYLPVIEKGRHLELPFITSTQEQEVIITADKSVYAQLDGELIEGKEFHINVLPGWFKVRY